jgi:hypothetical protein
MSFFILPSTFLRNLTVIGKNQKSFWIMIHILWCLLVPRLMALMALKVSSRLAKNTRSYRSKTVLFISYKVSQWQYNEAILSALWVAQNQHQQA